MSIRGGGFFCNFREVLIIVLGESMIEESMWVGVVLGINEVRVFKVYVGSGIIFNFYV